jgi:uncharacterized membrane protein YraQ (UPF0718 family)
MPAPSAQGDILMAFLSIWLEGAPFILVGTIISGFIDAFLPAKLLDRMLPRNRVLSTFVAGFMGLIFPVCECAVVPVVRRLVQKGLPISCAMTYLLAAPIINPIVIISTLTAFGEFKNLHSFADIGGATMTIGRVSLGYFVAVVIGLAILRRKPHDILRASIADSIQSNDASGDHVHEAPRSFNARLVHAQRTTMRDFLDTAMYFTIGALITAWFDTQVDQTRLAGVAGNELLATPTLMGLAYVLALCSTSDAFIAAPMAAFSYTAKLAFLVFGPMFDVKLTFMYLGVFRQRFVLILGASLFVLIALLSGPWWRILQWLFVK